MMNGEIDDTRRQEYIRLKAEAERNLERGKIEKIREILHHLNFDIISLFSISSKLKEGDETLASFGIIIENFIEKFESFGIMKIGKVGDEANFDPAKHSPLQSVGPIEIGTRVSITMLGLYFINEDGEEEVSLRAKVRPV